MDIDAIRRYCLRFPHVTENVQWVYDLVFKIDGKMFLVVRLEPGPVRMSFKAGDENFAELCERPGVRPAPYMARAQWIALEQLDTLPDSELRELLAESYRLVFERLPKKRQQELQSSATTVTATRKKKAAGKKTVKKLAGKRKPAKADGRG